MGISIAGVAFLILMCVVVPRLAMQSNRALEAGVTPPPPRAFLLGALVSQIVLVTIALLIAMVDRITLFPTFEFRLGHMVASLALFAAALALVPIRWRTQSEEEKRRSAMLLPRNARDLPLWACVSLAAGICEEIAYRGVLFQILDRPLAQLGWGWWPAAVIASAAFAAGHIVQGMTAVAIVFVFAIAFHALVQFTGNLYWAMSVHFVYNLLAGLIMWKLVQPSPLEIGRTEPE